MNTKQPTQVSNDISLNTKKNNVFVSPAGRIAVNCTPSIKIVCLIRKQAYVLNFPQIMSKHIFS